jgi:hypothetical protein
LERLFLRVPREYRSPGDKGVVGVGNSVSTRGKPGRLRLSVGCDFYISAGNDVMTRASDINIEADTGFQNSVCKAFPTQAVRSVTLIYDKPLSSNCRHYQSGLISF